MSYINFSETVTFTDVIILAGGFGERLWPASRPEYPKQFLALADGISFLQSALLRALAVKPTGKILIITREELINPISEHSAKLMPRLTEEERKKISDDLIIIAEPCPRHTCAPLVLACRYLELLDANAAEHTEHTMLVLTSDHVIGPIAHFTADCSKAAKTAQAGYFVCFSIPPNEPSTGYGYIRMGDMLAEDGSVATIAQFKEKPDLETAKAYIESGSYAWNSGMFAFTDTFFMGEVKTYAPEIYDSFKSFDTADIPETKTAKGISFISNWQAMTEAYSTVPAIAVDNAIAERTVRAATVKASFMWDDVGSWDAFEKYFHENDRKTIEVKASHNFVYSDIPVALCGVDDLVVVIKNGCALVMKKGASGNMREVVKEVKKSIKI